MNNVKTFLTWLVLCIVTAAGTILVVQALNKQLGLQPKVASFGKVR